MAYVRKKGNQLAIVHGERAAGSGEVVQNTLFTFFSKAEAYRAIGLGSKNQSHYFKHLLQEEHPAIEFNWEAINKGILDNLDVLPDLAEYREQRLAANFKGSLHAFTRELVQANPKSLVPSAKLLLEHKQQLEFLRDIIDMKIEHIDANKHDFNEDNEFYWRQTMQGWGINADVEQMASEIYHSGDSDAAIAAFGLLTDSFPNYAEGHNYLGLTYLESGKIDASIDHFRKTVQLGRKMFPKKTQKTMYWSDLKTRPYVRGLRNLAMSLVRQGSHDEALTICDTLETECNDAITAKSHRAAIFLNTKKWSHAEESALSIINTFPVEAAIAAFSQYEQGKLVEARKNFLFSLFNSPLGIDIMITGQAKKPQGFVEVQDYNGGIQLRETLSIFLKNQSAKSKSFFATILDQPDVQKYKEEVSTCASNHSKEKDQAKLIANFNRWHEIKDMNFAKKIAESL